MDSHDSFSTQDSVGARGDDFANSLLNFTNGSDDLDLQSVKRQKSARDPMSHRIIEKRRRDRMNNCLADLSRLIPTSYLKQGQGRIEKTEIIEMAIKHIKTLQTQVDSSQNATYNMAAMKRDSDTGVNGVASAVNDSYCGDGQFYAGFKECQQETLRYLVEGEAMTTSDSFCIRVMDHLTKAAQRYHLLARQGEENKDMEVENQQQLPLPGTGPYSISGAGGGGSITPLTQPPHPLPLLPSSQRLLSPSCSTTSSTSSPISNKQLRNLLSARALQNLEAEREVASGSTPNHSHDLKCRIESSMTTSNSMLACTVTSMNVESPLPSVQGGGGGGDCSHGGGATSSGYVSDTLERFSLGSVTGRGEGKDCGGGGMNAYKFKHNITKRFSQEGKAAVSSLHMSHNYDGSSSTSSRDAEDDAPLHHLSSKHRSLKSKNKYASSSDSGPYPMSDLSGTVSASSHDSTESDRGRNRIKERVGSEGSAQLPRSAVPLPGFLLHPSGTHYMPMSVSYSNIPDIFDGGGEWGEGGTPVFHPISIPVHFRGPVITVPQSSLFGQNSRKNSDTPSPPKDVKVVKKF